MATGEVAQVRILVRRRRIRDTAWYSWVPINDYGALCGVSFVIRQLHSFYTDLKPLIWGVWWRWGGRGELLSAKVLLNTQFNELKMNRILEINILRTYGLYCDAVAVMVVGKSRGVVPDSWWDRQACQAKLNDRLRNPAWHEKRPTPNAHAISPWQWHSPRFSLNSFVWSFKHRVSKVITQGRLLAPLSFASLFHSYSFLRQLLSSTLFARNLSERSHMFPSSRRLLVSLHPNILTPF